MTDDQIHTAMVRWIARITGKTTILAHQSGDAPALPYVMVNFTGSAKVREHPRQIEYIDTAVLNPDPNPSETTQISAAPVIEREWRYSVHAYDETSPTDILRPVESAAQLRGTFVEFEPGLTVYGISQIRDVPDFVNNDWEPRANMDIFLRGLTRDGFIVDVIGDISFDIGTQEPAP